MENSKWAQSSDNISNTEIQIEKRITENKIKTGNSNSHNKENPLHSRRVFLNGHRSYKRHFNPNHDLKIYQAQQPKAENEMRKSIDFRKYKQQATDYYDYEDSKEFVLTGIQDKD